MHQRIKVLVFSPYITKIGTSANTISLTTIFPELNIPIAGICNSEVKPLLHFMSKLTINNFPDIQLRRTELPGLNSPNFMHFIYPIFLNGLLVSIYVSDIFLWTITGTIGEMSGTEANV